MALCSAGGYSATCVIDGDTFRWRGEVIRILNIDAPETHPARCPAEFELASRAALRLLDILNTGGWHLQRRGRDRDRYGRSLRLVVIGATDAGSMLVVEGLARTWKGKRRPWCP